MSNLPIVEIFSSLQGEGTFVGSLMTFIRFAGCNVGRPLSSSDPLFPTYTRCTPAVGQSFICDTDYRRSIFMSVEELVETVKPLPARKVCLTGGEPLLHDLQPLVKALHELSKAVHLETSGTLPIPRWEWDWVACSPKMRFVSANEELVDEFKFLVSETTQLEDIEEFLRRECDWTEEELALPCMASVFLQPVNGFTTVDQGALKKAYWMLERRPNWQLSVQLHKMLGLR